MGALLESSSDEAVGGKGKGPRSNRHGFCGLELGCSHYRFKADAGMRVEDGLGEVVKGLFEAIMPTANYTGGVCPGEGLVCIKELLSSIVYYFITVLCC